MLPFAPEHRLRTVVILAVVGLIATILAMTRTFKFLFPAWAALVFYWLLQGFFFSPYTFPNADVFKNALWLILGANLALIGALWTLKPRRGRLYA